MATSTTDVLTRVSKMPYIRRDPLNTFMWDYARERLRAHIADNREAYLGEIATVLARYTDAGYVRAVITPPDNFMGGIADVAAGPMPTPEEILDTVIGEGMTISLTKPDEHGEMTWWTNVRVSMTYEVTEHRRLGQVTFDCWNTTACNGRTSCAGAAPFYDFCLVTDEEAAEITDASVGALVVTPEYAAAVDEARVAAEARAADKATAAALAAARAEAGAEDLVAADL